MAIEQGPIGTGHGVKVGAVIAAGALTAAAVGGAFAAVESGVFDSSGTTDKATTQTVEPTGQPALIPGTEIPNPLHTPDAIAATPTPIATESPTLSPTATPEKKMDVNCQIIPEQYCNKADLIDFTSVDGQKEKFLGFKLPAGTPLSSVYDGTLFTVQLDGKTVSGQGGLFVNSNDQTRHVTVAGDLVFQSEAAKDFKSGEVFASIGSEGTTNFGDYNLVIGFVLADTKTGIVRDDTSLFDTLFPGEIDKEPVKSVQATGTSVTIREGSPQFK